MGFKTFVVGIGDTMGAATLDQMAINGGMPQTGAATSFYQVTDTASLVAALQTILGRVGSCQFNIGMAPNTMTSTDFIDVFGDGTPIPRDTTHTDGWDYSNAAHTAIEVVRSALRRGQGRHHRERHRDVPLRDRWATADDLSPLAAPGLTLPPLPPCDRYAPCAFR